MVESAPCPGPDCWRGLLDGSLPDDEQAALNGHLETCPLCQRTLERLAADSAVWSGAARHLGEDRGDEAALRRVLADLEGPPALPSTVSGTPDSEDVSLAFLEPPSAPGQLGRLGRFEVLEVIGRGGMGVVLKAWNPRLKCDAAIKVLAPRLAAGDAARRRMLREAQAAAAVVHENVVRVYDVEEANGQPCLVMEYIPGTSLQERLNRGGPVGLEEALRIGLETAAGLAAAHARGVVHRDIKPANILLEADGGRVKITDFGLAGFAGRLPLPEATAEGTAREPGPEVLTRAGTVMGTPDYIAPEQAEDAHAADVRSDIYSLGCVLYRLLAGQVLFPEAGTRAKLTAHRETPPRPLTDFRRDLPAGLVRVVERMTAKDPAERFQSPAEVVAALAPFSGGNGSRARRLVLWSRRSFLVATAAVLLALGLIAAPAARHLLWPGADPVPGGEAPAAQEQAELAPVREIPVVREHRAFVGHEDIVWGLAFDRAGRRFVSGSGCKPDSLRGMRPGGDYTVRLWDVAEGQPLSSFTAKPALEGATEQVVAVAFADNDSAAVAVSKFRFLRLDLVGNNDRTRQRKVSGAWQMIAAISPDGRRAVTSTHDKFVCYWDLENDVLLDRWEASAGAVRRAAFSPDGRQVLVAGGGTVVAGKLMPAAASGHALGLWELAPGGAKLLAEYHGHTNFVWGVAFSPDGGRIVSGSADRTVRVWDRHSQKELSRTRNPGQSVTAVAFCADGRRVLSGQSDGAVRLWDADTGAELCRFEGYTREVRCLACAPDGRSFLSGGVDGSIRLWQLPEPPAKR